MRNVTPIPVLFVAIRGSVDGAVDFATVVIDRVPRNPAELVVLTVGVVVAPLSSPELISRRNHRHALGEEQGKKHVAQLPAPAAHHGEVFRWTLSAAVPAVVVVVPVAVLLPVCLIVLVVVADQITERDTVVGGHDVDA